MHTPAQQQQRSLSTSGGGSGGGAWGEQADAVLLHEVAALLSPSGTSTSSSSSSAALTGAAPTQQHRQQQSSAIDSTAHGGEGYDADRELALINEILDAQMQSQLPRCDLSEFQVFTLPAHVPPPPPPAPAASDLALLVPPSLASRSAKPVLKTTRERQKEELMQLRVQAAELEAQLESHKQLHREMFAAPAAAAASVSHRRQAVADRDETSWWARAAEHQQQEKSRAEQENAQLRDMALGQLRLAKSLEKVLEKRRVFPHLGQQPHKRLRPQSTIDSMCKDSDSCAQSMSSAPSTDEDAAVFTSLKSALSSRPVNSVDALFKDHGLDSVAQDTQDVAIKNRSPHEHVEFKITKLHPFDFRAVSDASWSCIQRELFDQSLDGVSDSDVVEASDSLVAFKLGLAPRPGIPPLTVRTVFKRSIEAKRAVYMYESQTETESAAASSSKSNKATASRVIRFKEQGWVTISPIRVPSASVASIMRHFSRMTLVVPDDPAGDSRARTAKVTGGRGALIDLLIALQLQSIHKTHETIQDMLIDAQVAPSASSSSSIPLSKTDRTRARVVE